MKCLTEKRVRDGVSRYRIKRQTLDRHKMMIVGIIEICPVWGRHNEGSKRRDSLTLYPCHANLDKLICTLPVYSSTLR